MKWLLLIPGIPAALMALAALAGALLPRDHVATRTAVFRRKPGELYAAARDFSGLPSWRRDLQGTEVLPGKDSGVSFREVSSRGTVTYRVLDDQPGERLVLQIADEGLPYGGTWTLEFSAADGNGAVRITERGFVKNVVWRFFARFVFGYTATMENYLRDLGQKFGETVTSRE